MNWYTIAILTILLTLIAIAQTRTVKRRRLVLFLLWLVLGVLLVRWARYRGAWDELLVSAGGALLLTTLWWVLYGRKLPPAQDNIRVWSKDDPF